MTATAVGERLRQWRKANALTQAEVAAMLSVDVTSYRKYELGVNAPGAPFLARLCALGVSINWLLIGVPPMTHQYQNSEEVFGSVELMLNELTQGMRDLYNENPSRFFVLINDFLTRNKDAIKLSKFESGTTHAAREAKKTTTDNQ